MESSIADALPTNLRPIAHLAEELGLLEGEVELHGRHKAKLSLSILERLAPRSDSKYIAISAVTPTPLGEGKTVTTIGLSMALNRLGVRAICTLRQPSLGPIFGSKGGATGGGASQVLPADEINLHLTGDFHAVTAAHNLLAAVLDASLYWKNPLGIDPERVHWKRAIDMNDRALRHVDVGLGGPKHGIPRRTGFEVTAASEVMSILALCGSVGDLRQRLGRIAVAQSARGRTIVAHELGCTGAMAALLAQAIHPTLLQTSAGTPALMHSGPFANLGPGNSSVLADRIALCLADVVVTESGFGADLGLEKLCNIKCRALGRAPDAVVLVASVRALKTHSGRFDTRAGTSPDPRLNREDLDSLGAGMPNLEKQVENARLHGLPVVVAINVFGGESGREIDFVRERALEAGACDAVTSEVFQKGGEGGLELARAALRAAESPHRFRHLYEVELPLRDKIQILATQLYGASTVSYAEEVEDKLDWCEANGWGKLPVCMAKTHLSLSHNPEWKGAPRGYAFPVTDVRVMAGAGFITPLAGNILTMPGLGADAGFRRIDVDADGNVVGLS